MNRIMTTTEDELHDWSSVTTPSFCECKMTMRLGSRPGPVPISSKCQLTHGVPQNLSRSVTDMERVRPSRYHLNHILRHPRREGDDLSPRSRRSRFQRQGTTPTDRQYLTPPTEYPLPLTEVTGPTPEIKSKTSPRRLMYRSRRTSTSCCCCCLRITSLRSTSPVSSISLLSSPNPRKSF